MSKPGGQQSRFKSLAPARVGIPQIRLGQRHFLVRNAAREQHLPIGKRCRSVPGTGQKPGVWHSLKGPGLGAEEFGLLYDVTIGTQSTEDQDVAVR